MTQAAPRPATTRPPRGRRATALVFAVTCGAQFSVIIDDTVVAMALPSIRADLDFKLASLAWVVDAYMLLFGCFLVLGGRCADLFGRRRVFLAGLTVFTLASLAGGAATSAEVLIAARAVQGLGAAFLSPAALSILVNAFTQAGERRRALGVWGGLTGISGVTGVLLGGIITDLISWRWVFFVNIPIGVLLFVLALRPALADRDTPGSRVRLDTSGAVLLTGGLLLLVHSVISTESRSWTSLATVAGLAGAAGLLALFALREIKGSDPLIRLSIFRNRPVVLANAMVLLAASGLYGIFFFLTQYMQVIQGWSPLRAGLSWAPFGITMAVFSGLAIQLLPRLGARALSAGGLTVASIGLGLLLRTTTDGGYAGQVLPTLLLCAAGFGLAFVPLVVAAVSGVGRSDAGAASGILNSGQQIGGAVGLAVLASLASSRLSSETATGTAPPDALLSSYHTAFLTGTLLTAAAALLALALPPLRTEFDPETTQGV
ncbi:MFS transporter [Streptomyces sp. JJ66]|uniref:MFS transporter n=1 Tax=Streptomyces sp. JJ66 TaxID=2803843 RepID=UPI001C59145E|nr:MFS transporter [Streptomyces sp. JJ66]MBW1602236.1 MFS transporter [Streptomyces sp. JJ66]